MELVDGSLHLLELGRYRRMLGHATPNRYYSNLCSNTWIILSYDLFFALLNSRTTTSHLISWHKRLRRLASSLEANSRPLARSTASSGTSNSDSRLSFGMRALGKTNAPSATLLDGEEVPSSAKTTL